MASNNLVSLLSWAFLPNLVTGWVQSIYYGLTIRAGDPRPAPNTPRYNEHRRRIHILVVSAYLLYTIYEADWELRRASTFYADLGVPFSASERDVKSRFRRLATLHHPDKVASSSSGTETGGGDDFFIHLKTASDTLTDPAHRFAYDRFGPEVVGWKHCVTVRDYVVRGVQSVIPYYGGAAVVMYVLGLLGYLDWGRYWRWLTLVALCVFEVHTVTRPRYPWFLEAVVNPVLNLLTATSAQLPGAIRQRVTTSDVSLLRPPYLPFQAILLARKLSITLYIAFSQIGPLLRPASAQAATSTTRADDRSEKTLSQNLDRLEQTARSLDVDAARLMELEMSPFAGDAEVVAGMRSKMKEWLIQNTIRADPMVRDALGRSLQKRRVDAPAGARGNR